MESGWPAVTDSTTRFSNRAGYYAESRPHYAPGVIPLLAERAGFSAESVVVDVGSGTGISSELFLPHCRAVYGVEPNDEMRGAAERILAPFANFHSVCGVAENTTLPAACADFVVSGASFHWFDLERCRVEFQRILRPGGHVVVLTNRRREEASAFMQGYVGLYAKYGDRRVHPEWEQMMDALFGRGRYQRGAFDNPERIDFRHLLGRLLSFSVMPLPGQPGHEAMAAELRSLFEQHAHDGAVEFFSETQVFFGIPGAA